jgi:hypothetical protein
MRAARATGELRAPFMPQGAAICGHQRMRTASNGIRSPAQQFMFSLLRTMESRSELVVRGRVELPTFRFSGERPGPRESTTVRLIRPDDLLWHLGVQDRPRVSTTAVSTALAARLCIRDP